MTLEEAKGLGWQKGIHPEDREQAVNLWVDFVNGLRPWDFEYRFLSPQGNETWVWATASPIKNEQGETTGYIGANIDITDRRRAEEQLQQSQKMESIGRLAGGIAHDFNNTLQVILSYANFALREVDPSSKLHHDLVEIRNAGQRSADLTRQLLAFARKQIIIPKVLDLNDVVGSTRNMIQRLIGEDVALCLIPGMDLWSVHADPSQMDQIIANLAVNARDAISGIGSITFETANVTIDEAHVHRNPSLVKGEFVLLAVTDTGVGMDEATQAHLFEPFFTTKEVGKGTGLGLATVYGIVKQNNGFINVYSEVGHGTTFKIYLPRFRSSTDKPSAESEPASSLGGWETILIAEDDPGVLETAKRDLELRGYYLLAAATPENAIAIAEAYEGLIHLLLTDVVMPGMNGKELSKRLKKLKPNMKTVFMSGYTANVIAHLGTLDGGVQFLQKPFSESALAAKVRETLDGK